MFKRICLHIGDSFVIMHTVTALPATEFNLHLVRPRKGLAKTLPTYVSDPESNFLVHFLLPLTRPSTDLAFLMRVALKHPPGYKLMRLVSFIINECRKQDAWKALDRNIFKNFTKLLRVCNPTGLDKI